MPKTVFSTEIQGAFSGTTISEAALLWAFDHDYRMATKIPGRILLKSKKGVVSALFARDYSECPATAIVKWNPNHNGHVCLDILVDPGWSTIHPEKINQDYFSSLGQRFVKILSDLNGAGARVGSSANGRQACSFMSFEDACAIFELEKDAITIQNVERRYKELVKLYHPDRYAGQGLPKEMLDAAVQRFNEIVSAYEYLKKHLQI